MRILLKFLNFGVSAFLGAVVLGGGAGQAQESARQPDLRLVEIRLDQSALESVARNEAAFVGFSALFDYSPAIAHSVQSMVAERVREMRVFETTGLGVLSVPIGISRIENDSRLLDNETGGNSVAAYGSITIPGKTVNVINGAFGQTLSISVSDPFSGFQSNQVRIRFFGVTNIELLIAVGISGYLIVAAGYMTWQRSRRRREAREEMVRMMRLREQKEEAFRGIKSKNTGRARPMTAVPDVPQVLVDDLISGQAVLGIGSGLSEHAGQQDWRGILISLNDALSGRLTHSVQRLFVDTISTQAREIDITDMSDLMEAVMSNIPREELAGVLHDILDTDHLRLSLHAQLAEMPWSGVMSLTLDDVGREVFVEQFSRTSEISPDAITMLPSDRGVLRQALQDRTPFFLDALGDLRAPETAALSLSEVRKNLTRTPEYARQIALLLDTRSFLFVGVSAGGLREYLQSFNPSQRQSNIRHFALVPFDPDNDRSVDTLKRFGVELLEYDDDADPKAMEKFIRSFDERLREASRTARPAREKRVGLNPEFATQRIQKLHLKNIGPFPELTLEFTQTDAGTRPCNWTVILGQNGVGKTGVLRAIAVALTAGETSVASAANGLLTYGKNEGKISLDMGRQVMDVELVRYRDVNLIARQTSPVEAGQILVLGFPALRGAPSNDPSGPTTHTEQPPEPNDLLPLILGDIDPRMPDFKQWILNVLNNSQRDEKSRAIRQLLDDIICNLVPGGFDGFDDLDVHHVLRLRRSDPSLPPVPFSAVSQGMSSIFNWIGVLAKRLYEVYELDTEIPPHHRHAIVLIDEIETHLHPDWQRRLVALAKEFFPNVQVIASTHSALVASSLQSDEIKILERFEGGEFIARAPATRTYGKSADYIMQSDVLGLQVARPLHVERKITEYKDLFSQFERNETDNKRLKTLSSELADVGWAGVEGASEHQGEKVTDDEMIDFLKSIDK